MKKKLLANGQSKSPTKEQMDTGGIKFPDFKAGGTSLRSQRMKLPPTVGQKKAKAIDQMLKEAGVDSIPVPSENMCTQFNELRSDMVLLYELKAALGRLRPVYTAFHIVFSRKKGVFLHAK